MRQEMEVNSINRGIVIDHIRAGFGMKVLSYLGVDTSKDTVALIMNATSGKHGRKDIIKIENLTDVDIAALGLLDHSATVNVIEDGKIRQKIHLSLPETVKDVIKCKNPRCVTSVEPAIPHIFRLVDAAREEYRCEYCDEIVRLT
jgi:aspartate carbamoyltransferase regulatory subunit